jgi:hypothetical protein
LDILPTVVLKRIAGYIKELPLVQFLLPLYPHLLTELRSGVPWPTYCERDFQHVNDARALEMIAVDSVRSVTIIRRPGGLERLAKVKRMLR